MAINKFHESFLWAANAAADLTEKLNYFAKVDSNGEIAVAGAGDPVLGVILETAVAGKPATVQFGCIGKVISAGSIAAGASIASDGNGKAVTAGAATFVVGIALVAAEAGELLTFAFVSGRTAA